MQWILGRGGLEAPDSNSRKTWKKVLIFSTFFPSPTQSDALVGTEKSDTLMHFSSTLITKLKSGLCDRNSLGSEDSFGSRQCVFQRLYLQCNKQEMFAVRFISETLTPPGENKRRAVSVCVCACCVHRSNTILHNVCLANLECHPPHLHTSHGVQEKPRWLAASDGRCKMVRRVTIPPWWLLFCRSKGI